MRKVLFFLSFIILCISSYAIAQPANVVFTKPVGTTLLIKAALSTAGTVDVDWGDGVLVTVPVGITQTSGGSTQITGTVKSSGNVLIYGSTLVWMNITSQGLTGVDISNLPGLKVIDVSRNNISSVDVSNNTELSYLGIHTNDLSVLNVSTNTKLQTLACNNNMLTVLDISNNTLLKTLTASANTGLNTLNVSTNTALTSLLVAGNGMTTIDLSNNTALTTVNISANEFTFNVLNSVYDDLPTLGSMPGSVNLKITSNPGALASNTPVVTAKNWNVDVTGDPLLPLNLTSFTGALKEFNNEVSLKWITNSEVNTKEFAIERADDAGVFTVIGNVVSKNVSGVNNYTFIDEQPLNGSSYYRLNQIDIDGESTYSKLVVIQNNDVLSFQLYPNPVLDGVVKISHPVTSTDNAFISIYSINGAKVVSQNVPEGVTSTTLDISNLTKATYVVVYIDGVLVNTKKLIVN